MIEEGLTATLKACWPGVNAYPVYVPENVPPPFIVYREVDIDDDDSVAFEIDACAVKGLEADDYRKSKQLAEAVRLALLNGFSYADGCVTRCELSKRQDHVDKVDPMHWTRAQYTLTLTQNPY